MKNETEIMNMSIDNAEYLINIMFDIIVGQIQDDVYANIAYKDYSESQLNDIADSLAMDMLSLDSETYDKIFHGEYQIVS